MASIEMIGSPADGSSNPSGHLHAVEVVNITRSLRGEGVIGHTETMTVTGTDMIVTIPAFDAMVPDGSGGQIAVSYAGGNVTISASDPTNPRTDIITVDSAGNVGATAGSPTAETGSVEEAPMPALASDEILLAKVRVEAGVTVIGTTKVVGRAIDVSENTRFTEKSADIASASTPSFTANNAQYSHITGTTGITALGTKRAGFVRILEFDGALTITHNATSLILLSGRSMVTVAGDVFGFISEGSGNWRQIFGPSSPNGLELVGSNTTEQTTTSTSSTDMVTVTLSRAVQETEGLLIVWNVRKTTGGLYFAQTAVKVESTVVWGSQTWATQVNQTESGWVEVRIPPYRSAYAGLALPYGVSSLGIMATPNAVNMYIGSARPSGTISSVVVRGNVENASITMGVQDVRVYAMKAS